jgi:hypothetical protein
MTRRSQAYQHLILTQRLMSAKSLRQFLLKRSRERTLLSNVRATARKRCGLASVSD